MALTISAGEPDLVGAEALAGAGTTGAGIDLGAGAGTTGAGVLVSAGVLALAGAGDQVLVIGARLDFMATIIIIITIPEEDMQLTTVEGRI